MATFVCISVRLLHPVYHGRGLDDEPEWPPSPLRIYQALVAAASRDKQAFSAEGLRAVETLERLEAPPMLIAPAVSVGDGYRLSVPNNSMDKVGAAWSRGEYFGKGDASPAGHRAMKRVRPAHLPDEAAVHCVWSASPEVGEKESAFTELRRVARCIVSLGWGIDVAVGDATLITEDEARALPGERWLPGRLDGKTGLRIPVIGTLTDLQRRHQQFMKRMVVEGYHPPEPLTKFRVVEYRRASAPAPLPVACFELVRPEGGFRPFGPTRNTVHVAGMLRFAAKVAAMDAGGWPDPASFVLGHGETLGDRHRSVDNRRFAYLPLPSIQPRGMRRSPVVGSIRRVCVTVLQPSHEHEVDWAKRMLSGRELVREETGEIAAFLAPCGEQDPVLRPFLGSASEWASVSPVVLPGYDDPGHCRRRLAKGNITVDEQRRLLGLLSSRADALLRKAILNAGFPEEIAMYADLDWRNGGFWSGIELATSYAVPKHLTRFPRLHVRVKWRNAHGEPVMIRGPICLGGGRFYGIGLFASIAS